jgi:hypothetical protein
MILRISVEMKSKEIWTEKNEISMDHTNEKPQLVRMWRGKDSAGEARD